jgi:ABC-type transporter Mla MlaB component
MKRVNADAVFKRFTYKINNMDEAEVCASRKRHSGRVTVTIKLVGVLDLRAVDLMHSIYEFARNFKAARIVVDLGRTHRIHDSGLAMLLMLKNRLGSQIEKIKLIRTGHLTNNRFCYLPVAFEIEH